MSDDSAEFAASVAGRALLEAARMDRRGAFAAIQAFVDIHGAGYPDVPMFPEQVRAEAVLWASAAHQAELEAYLVAALTELEESPLTRKAAKRLAALAWRRMGPEGQEAFKGWIEKQ